MTTKLALSPTPKDLQAVHCQFEQWRQTRELGARIPAPLWAAAVAVAQRHGVYRTARQLHLESRKLKRLTEAAWPGARGPASAPTFVELVAPATGSSAECAIEIEGPRGGWLRVQVRGAAPLDVVALSRVLWGRRG